MQVDYLTSIGALKLARMIESYWESRGFTDVTVRVVRAGRVPVPRSDGHTSPDHFIVRSNLDGRGLPPSATSRADLRRLQQRVVAKRGARHA